MNRPSALTTGEKNIPNVRSFGKYTYQVPVVEAPVREICCSET